MSAEHPLKQLEHILASDPIPGHAGEPERSSEPMPDRTGEPAPDRATEPGAQRAAAALGTLMSVSGSQGMVHFGASALADDEAYVTVGSYLGIRTRHSLVIGVLCEIHFDRRRGERQAARRPAAASTCWARSSPMTPAPSASAAASRTIRRSAAPSIRIGDAELRLIFDVARPEHDQRRPPAAGPLDRRLRRRRGDGAEAFRHLRLDRRRQVERRRADPARDHGGAAWSCASC